MSIFLRLRTDGWYVVTKGKICLFDFVFCCRADCLLLKLTSDSVFCITQSEIQDDDLESPERPKTPEGFPPQEEFDLLYNSKYDMEESEEPSPPSSQYEPRHKEYPQHKKKESSLPKGPGERKGPGEHKSRKRKHMDTVSLETNIKKSKDSITKLENHMMNKTCPQSFQYSARANIPPDETFLREIKEIKEQAEQSFVGALTRYHKRRLKKQENKRNKAKLFTKIKGAL